MRTIVWLPLSCAVMLTLSGCANNGGSAGSSPSGTGPFDSQGNYHEEWANDPSKWRKPGSHSQPSDDLPVVAKNEQPPLNASPFAAPEAATKAKTTPARTARHTSEPKEASSKRKPAAEPSATRKTNSHVVSKTSARKTTAQDDEDTPKAKSKTAPKATTKPAAKGSRYTVKKGDTLFTIAERSNSSAAEIRKANGLSGTRLEPGKSLVIPK
ncbi:MAG: LysM peptidoglycan-binding domain-containing protein [Verrucomicrobiota bacterium]